MADKSAPHVKGVSGSFMAAYDDDVASVGGGDRKRWRPIAERSTSEAFFSFMGVSMNF